MSPSLLMAPINQLTEFQAGSRLPVWRDNEEYVFFNGAIFFCDFKGPWSLVDWVSLMVSIKTGSLRWRLVCACSYKFDPGLFRAKDKPQVRPSGWDAK